MKNGSQILRNKTLPDVLVSDLEQRPLLLRTHPDPLLRDASIFVEAFDNSLWAFCIDMLTFMRERKGVGLAAPQVGILQRIVVVDIGDVPKFLINPRIATKIGADRMIEGCLSLSGQQFQVERNTEIGIRAKTPLGKKVRFEANGLLARVLQHEVDHLNGILICDHGTRVQENGEHKEGTNISVERDKDEHFT